MLVYKLDKPIPAEKLIKDVERLVSKNATNIENLVLVITLHPITDTNTTLIPKIEYKPCTT